MAAVWLLVATLARAGYAPPADSLIDDRTLSAIHDDLTSQHWDDAAQHIDAALGSPPALAKIDDRIVPLARVIAEQLTDNAARAALGEAFEKAVGPTASAALEAAVRAGDSTTIAGVARRWPWTQAGLRAPAELAKQLASVGDLSGVQSLLRTADDSPAKTNDADASLKPLAALPADTPGRPVITAAAWYNLIRPIDFSRSNLVGAKDTIFIATPTAAAAVNTVGRLLWSVGAAPPPVTIPKQAEHMPKSMQASLFAEHAVAEPAVWCDAGGTARVVVVRQSAADTSVLTALRAENGTPLWSTADDESTRSLRVLGSPLIRGRYVYAAALEEQPPALPRVCLIALDLPSGRLLWRSDIGDATPAGPGAADPRAGLGLSVSASLIANSSLELAADDASVYASLEGGSVVSVARFAGTLNWISPYAAAPGDRRDLPRQRQGKDRPVLHRWRDRVVVAAGVAVVAPTDSPNVVAYDAATGKRAWILDDGDGAELVGVAGGNLILAGSKLLALSPGGAAAWQVDYTNAPTGPAIIDGDTVLTPTQVGVTVYAAATGKASLTPPKTLLVADMLGRQIVTKKALDKLGLLDSFAAPPDVGPAPEPPKPVKPAKKK